MHEESLVRAPRRTSPVFEKPIDAERVKEALRQSAFVARRVVQQLQKPPTPAPVPPPPPATERPDPDATHEGNPGW